MQRIVLSPSHSQSTFRNSLPFRTWHRSLKKTAHDHAARILWINTLPLDVTSKQGISLITELFSGPAVGQETECLPTPTLSDRDS
jgi:hypothetical protein